MPRRPTITNEEILEAARQVFLEQGIGASTVDIAEKAGISEASIFKRFATKQALFEAAMDIAEKPKWLKALAKQTPSENFKAELTDICKQMLASYQEMVPRVMMIMGQGNMPPLPPVPPPPLRDTRLLAEYLEGAIALGYLRPCSSIAVGHLIVGAMMNYVIVSNVTITNLSALESFLVPEAIAADQFVTTLIEVLWQGIAPHT